MFCDRCFKEYEDDEVVRFDRESPMWICLPCKWEFDDRLKNFLIEFFNSQPEHRNDVASSLTNGTQTNTSHTSTSFLS